MNTTNQSKLRAAIYCLYGAGSLCAVQTASAAIDSMPTRIVSYADLDISKPAGAKVLYHRIAAAAQQVCVLDIKDLGAAQRDRTCIRQAIDTAVKGVNSFTEAGMIFSLEVELADGRKISVKSDSTWRIIPDGVQC